MIEQKINNIIAIPRETLNKASTKKLITARNKFPFNLSTENYIEIGVYDTEHADVVNLGLSGAAEQIKKTVKTSFEKVNTAGGAANFVKDTHNTAGANKKLRQIFKGSYFLPFPNNLSEQMAHSYSEQPGWADSVLNQTPIVKSFKDAGTSGLAGVAATYAKATGSQAIKYYENKIQMYESTSFRTISLEWTLVPNNQAEQKALYEIIRELKMYSHPDTMAGKLLLRSPHFFKIKFNTPTLEKSLQFTEVNITSMGIEYSPGGQMEKYHDNTPKSLTLTIEFQDREPKTHQDWENPQKETFMGGAC